MKLFNSLTNNYFDFAQFKKSSEPINWYCCGPTIYNDSHLGHARTYIIFDSMVKFLRSQGYNIVYRMNITDIDDKIINKVNKLYQSMLEIKEHTDVYDFDKFNLFKQFIQKQESSFWEDLEKLNVEKPNKILRVTDVIPDIINFIHQLISDGFAYVGKSNEPNKSIYFNSCQIF
jgi:cysteinyl-tRNA synthetase